jgi:hypothetical protein
MFQLTYIQYIIWRYFVYREDEHLEDQALGKLAEVFSPDHFFLYKTVVDDLLRECSSMVRNLYQK